MPDERFSRQLRSDKGILSPDKEQIMFIEQMIEIGLGDERERSDARLVITGVFWLPLADLCLGRAWCHVQHNG